MWEGLKDAGGDFGSVISSEVVEMVISRDYLAPDIVNPKCSEIGFECFINSGQLFVNESGQLLSEFSLLESSNHPL